MTYDERGLYIENAQLERFAENLARTAKIDGECSGRAEALRLKKTLGALSETYDALSLKWRENAAMPEKVRWFLDNCYLARIEGMEASRALAEAERLMSSEGRPVICLLCAGLVRAGHFDINSERLELFLEGYQHCVILGLSELAVLGAALRLELIEALRECAEGLGEDARPGIESDLQNIFTSLRYLASCDLSGLIEKADYTGQILSEDPSGVYPLMDEESRAFYRQTLSRLAKKRKAPEYRLAKMVLDLAKHGKNEQAHVGYWLLREPLGYRSAQKHGGAYIASGVLATLFLSLLIGFATNSPIAALLLLLPVSELIKQLMDFVILKLYPPARLPRLELPDGIPDDGTVLCVVSDILSGEMDGERLARRLEEYRLCNRECGKNLLFAILADLPDTENEEVPGSAGWLKNAAGAIETLNRRYGGGFFLLTRPRIRVGKRYMGWERKRGALLETMRLLRGKESRIVCAAGEKERLQNVRFLLALDSDTRLTPGAARRLAGAMLHPLNRPVIDAGSRVVKSGHGVISPRVETELASAVKSDFSRIFAGPGGSDPYDSACGQVYMDVWGSGGFAGKGMIDIDAYLQCLDGRIPEGRVLSHDAIEGAVLRGGYMGDTELCDGFPAGPLSYYKRLHRWTRGDWQNISWLFSRGKALPDIERFKIFDSLRRSLVPASTLLAICAGFFIPNVGMTVAAAAALLSCACQLILTAIQTLWRREADVRARYRSPVYFGVGGALVRTLVHLVLLPAEAFSCIDAVLRSAWRMLVSKHSLLQWQTAGQSDALRSTVIGLYAAMWPAAALGVLLMLLSPSVLGKAVGLIWLLSPACAYILGLPEKGTEELPARDRDYLLKCAREIWLFFNETLCENDNFLPPDNFQEQPPAGVAHRTSPTNIGLALLSAIAACDLTIETASRSMFIIERCLDTLDTLEKWHGHLYNWYDTETLCPLEPAYISTVDSGNLYACLVALRQALHEKNRPDLAARAQKLAESMDFQPLVDKKRNQLYIGIDARTGECSEAHYDLLSSEARLTAYAVIAKGDAGKKLWQCLSRAQVQKNGYRGMVSWTGSMFEYLMPELLLPLYRYSRLYETACFCVYVQKRRAARANAPWGISESAFYSLDPSMNYRYKAHGCGVLSLKRSMDDELVVSPYSSFLALAVSRRSAVKNLRAIEKYGMRSRFGFWEALDFTPSRGLSGRPDPVRCVMAHHLGMSMISVANCLRPGLMTKRFMGDARMSAYAGLLQERIPQGGAALRKRADFMPPQKRREFDETWVRSGSGAQFERTECCLLSSMSYSLMMTQTGLSVPQWGRITPYLPGQGASISGKGMDLRFETGGESHPLLPASAADGGLLWSFTPERASISLMRPGFVSELETVLAKDFSGERRKIRLSFPQKQSDAAGENEAALRLAFTPCLAQMSDFTSHPAFCKLGLSAKVKNGCLVVRRLRRGKSPQMFLCLASDFPCVFKNLPGGDEERFSVGRTLGEREYFMTEPRIECSVALTEGRDACVCFSLCVAKSEEDAIKSAMETLKMADSEAGDLPRRAAAVIGMGKEELTRAWSLLPWLYFPTCPLRGGDFRRDGLWKFGISGDLPIVCAKLDNLSQLLSARGMMDSHLLLSGCGREFDLVFITHDKPGYRRPLYTALSELLLKNGGDALEGARGGVHIVEEADGADGVRACAALRVLLRPDGLADCGTETPPGEQFKRREKALRCLTPEYAWDEDGSFCFAARDGLPPRTWSNILTNGRMGYLASDSGSGNLWFINSRENQISPWLCRPMAVSGPESLVLELNGETISLFAGEGDYCVKFGFGYCVWEKRAFGAKTKVTAFVPPDSDARVFLIECGNAPDGAEIVWRLTLQMAPAREDARYVETACRDGLLLAQNRRSIQPNGCFLASTLPRFREFTCAGDSAARGVFDGKTGVDAAPVFAVRLPAGEKSIIACSCGAPEELRELCSAAGAERALQRTKEFWNAKTGALQVETPDRALNKIMNGWCLYQTTACRVMGRCSIYQSGGAYGFRDQLQDAVNLLPFDRSIARAQILRSCRRQYAEGDVQHWWHEGGDAVRGVRTRCSDDLLWLPWAVCEYVEKTGDLSICAEKTAYLTSKPLSAGEHDRYEAPAESAYEESVMSHCVRTLEKTLERGAGEHGLLKFGGGDWNDGFDGVGGESEWLTWFFCHTASRFARLAEALEPGAGEKYMRECEKLRRAAENAWDGQWFLRGYYADGTPLGSRQSGECAVDSVAQSFAALCPGVDRQRVETALDSAVKMLFERDDDVVRLFYPPFDASKRYPGYIESYGPGFRENGGQYTHGALWLAMALLKTGRTDEGWEILRALLPADKKTERYRGEPYVISADVYCADGHMGEAGWTWYTGSAGWLLRIVTEELLGLRLKSGRLTVEPCLPSDWEGYKASFLGHEIIVRKGEITVDGEKYLGGIAL